MKSEAVRNDQLSKCSTEQKSNVVDEYGFFSPTEGNDHTSGVTHSNADSVSSSPLPWTDDALCREESWWASDFLLYLSWKSALCTRADDVGENNRAVGSVSIRNGAYIETPDESRSVIATGLPSQPPVTVAAAVTSTVHDTIASACEDVGVGSSSPTAVSPRIHRPPSLQQQHQRQQSGETDAALMERWFRGRWEDRLRQYGGCPHMSLRSLLWGFFSGAWQQTALQQEMEAAQYDAAVPAESYTAGLATQPDYVAALEAIDRDIGRTFPHHILFHSGVADSTGQRQLRRLLRAYAARDPEVGYCQGMAFVAAVVLMVAPETQAYQIFCALMSDGETTTLAAASTGYRHGMRQLYRSGFPLLQKLLAELESHVQLLLPALAAHLQSSDVLISMFASRWFLTLFVHQLPPPLLLRVWDFFLVRGWSVMVQVAVALLQQEQGALLKLNMEGILLHLKVVRSERQCEGVLLRRVCNAPLL